jgi:beta-aspartyl-dipeptidase (metallo-type)
MKLLKQADVYAPEHLGRRDILLEGDKIAAIEEDLSFWAAIPQVEVEDLQGAIVCPGFVDMHIHVTGGGGEDGPASRVPEITLSQLTENGVTTLVGLLGTDGISRSLENLLTKVCALEEEGVTAYMLTGSYGYPSVTLTENVERDLVLLDKVVGVKAAVSDHRGSNITVEQLISLGTQARRGGMLSGKAGIVTLHMGSGKAGLDPVFQALAQSDIPQRVFLPTHVGRTQALTDQAVRYTQQGGFADFTASEEPGGTGTACKVAYALAKGADPSKITMSSDSCGSLPRFDENGRCVGMTYTTPVSLGWELKRMVNQQNLSLSQALAFFTQNPAAVLGLAGRKGCLAPGADGDMLVLKPDLSIDRVYARGVKMVQDGKAVVKGRFEL